MIQYDILGGKSLVKESKRKVPKGIPAGVSTEVKKRWKDLPIVKP